MITEGWLVIYMDDILIAFPDPKTHTELTCHALQHMTKLNLYLPFEKCQFNVSEIEYLGMIIKSSQLAMDLVKLDGITAWLTSTKVKEVHSFLGFINFYYWFIPDYSTVTHPLLNLTKKDNCWDWTPTCQQLFNELKKLFLSCPVLHLLILPSHLLLPLMPPSMPLVLSSSKLTLIVTGTPVHIFLSHLSLQNETMISTYCMIMNSLQLSMPWNLGSTIFTAPPSLYKSSHITRTWYTFVKPRILTTDKQDGCLTLQTLI